MKKKSSEDPKIKVKTKRKKINLKKKKVVQDIMNFVAVMQEYLCSTLVPYRLS